MDSRSLSVVTAGLDALGASRTMRGSVVRDRNSALAQLVEQLTVNQRVAGSSPAGGAIFLYSIQSLVRTWCNSTLLLKACGNTMETSTFK